MEVPRSCGTWSNSSEEATTPRVRPRRSPRSAIGAQRGPTRAPRQAALCVGRLASAYLAPFDGCFLVRGRVAAPRQLGAIVGVEQTPQGVARGPRWDLGPTERRAGRGGATQLHGAHSGASVS